MTARFAESGIIDVHSHPLFPSYLKALALESGGVNGEATAYGVPLPAWSLTQQLEVMEMNGIGISIMSPASLAEAIAGRKGRALARAINEEMATTVSEHPDRLGAFAIVPMDDMDAAIEESAYALDTLGLDGVYAPTHRGGIYLGDPFYNPWLDELNRRSATLFVHPLQPPNFDAAKNRLHVAILDFMFETTRMVTSMVLSGAKQRFHHINIIATHGGGAVPYLAQRIALGGQMPWAFKGGVEQSMEQIMAAISSFYYDLTASTSKAQLDALHDLVPAERLLMGFDYPLMPPQTIGPTIAGLKAYEGFGDEVKLKIARGNAIELFPRLNR